MCRIASRNGNWVQRYLAPSHIGFSVSNWLHVWMLLWKMGHIVSCNQQTPCFLQRGVLRLLFDGRRGSTMWAASRRRRAFQLQGPICRGLRGIHLRSGWRLHQPSGYWWLRVGWWSCGGYRIWLQHDRRSFARCHRWTRRDICSLDISIVRRHIYPPFRLARCTTHKWFKRANVGRWITCATSPAPKIPTRSFFGVVWVMIAVAADFGGIKYNQIPIVCVWRTLNCHWTGSKLHHGSFSNSPLRAGRPTWRV